MDETAFRQRLAELHERSCPFAKSILTRCAACSNSTKRNIAEREIVTCASADAHARCVALKDLLRHNFAFALGKLHVEDPLPHAQEMRMQCGGIKGLQVLIDESDEVGDIDGLLEAAKQKFGELEDFPYSQIIRLAKEHYKGR